jgi:hypothetical protein
MLKARVPERKSLASIEKGNKERGVGCRAGRFKVAIDKWCGKCCPANDDEGQLTAPHVVSLSTPAGREFYRGQWLPKTAAFDPVAPRRARDRVPSILALGLFLTVSDFTQPENGLPTPPLPFPSLPFPYTGYHQTASYSPKMAPLHFCTSGSEMPLTEEPGLYKRPCPRSPSHSVSTTNTLSGALCLRPLPSASRTSSLDYYRPHHPRPSHLLAVLPLPSSPAVLPANHGP